MKRLSNNGIVVPGLMAVVMMAGNVSLANAGTDVTLMPAQIETLKGDFPGLARLCNPPSPPMTEERGHARVWKLPPPFPAAQVFDNLYFVGTSGVSAWAITTSEGIILIDALNTEDEVKAFVEPGLRKFGLDPKDIRYIIVAHGHGDHYGGAPYLVRTYNPRIVMGKADWDDLQAENGEAVKAGWEAPPYPEVQVSERQMLRLGDTEVELVPSPGHTLGTISIIFKVTEGDKTHKAVLWGGTGFNFGPSAERYEIYARSSDLMAQEVRSQGIDIFLSNHLNRDRSGDRLKKLAERKSGEANPFVTSPDHVVGAFRLMSYCARSQAGQLKAPL